MNFWIKDLTTGLKITREAESWSDIKRWVTTEWGWQGGSYMIAANGEAWVRNFKGNLKPSDRGPWLRVVSDESKPGPKQKFSTPCKRRSISLPEHYWDKLNEIAERDFYGSVSALIRNAINEKYDGF